MVETEGRGEVLLEDEAVRDRPRAAAKEDWQHEKPYRTLAAILVRNGNNLVTTRWEFKAVVDDGKHKSYDMVVARRWRYRQNSSTQS